MLHTLLKMSMGVIIGAVLVKENSNASAAYDKAKARIKELIGKISAQEVTESPAENK